jgi:hypothetical protein
VNLTRLIFLVAEDARQANAGDERRGHQHDGEARTG